MLNLGVLVTFLAASVYSYRVLGPMIVGIFYVLKVRTLYPFLLYYMYCCLVEEVCLVEAGIM